MLFVYTSLHIVDKTVQKFPKMGITLSFTLFPHHHKQPNHREIHSFMHQNKKICSYYCIQCGQFCGKLSIIVDNFL